MRKLLHERLKEYCDLRRLSLECEGMEILSLSNSKAEALANEIEHYYIPRPRYEDGLPVQFGDDIEVHNQSGLLDKGIIQSFHPNNGSVWIISLVGCDHERLVRFDPKTCIIKRPAPKVLDADGVEIEVGEAVYKLSDGTEWRVEDIHPKEPRITVKQLNTDKDVCGGWFLANGYTHKKPVFDANGKRICKGDTVWDKETGARLTVVSPCSYTKDGTFVTCKDGAPGELWYKPEALTHREPDSLEKLRDDIKKAGLTFDAASAHIGEHCNATKWADRLTALIERGA